MMPSRHSRVPGVIDHDPLGNSFSICLITPGRLGVGDSGSEAASLVGKLSEAARSGVDIIQIREKNLSARDLVTLVSDVMEATVGTGVRVLVNDRFDVAIAGGAHGVHLTSRSIPGDVVRSKCPADFLIGKSTHSLDEIEVARAFADYVFFSPIFETTSKRGVIEPKGLEGLRFAVEAAKPLPVLALGGISVGNAAAVAEAGASGVAGIGLFDDADVAATVDHIRRLCR